MDAGELVPDEVTNAMVADRLAQPDARSGFLLDGYPRNVGQADVLAELLSASGAHLDAVVEIVVDTEHLLERLRARGQGRVDDAEDVIRHRLDVYASETAPLVDYYRALSLLRTVDGVGAVEDVSARILDVLS
jgi:adenylate kinase